MTKLDIISPSWTDHDAESIKSADQIMWEFLIFESEMAGQIKKFDKIHMLSHSI